MAAVTDAYARGSDYRAVISGTKASDNDQLEEDLTAVSRYIDRKLGQFFTLDASAVARTFIGQGGPKLYLRLDDDFCPGIGSTSGLAIKVDEDGDGSFADETAWASTDYELWPLNAASGPEPSPWTVIHIPSWSSKSSWPVGNRIQVTAKWGWPAVPAPIKRATIDLTSILRLEGSRATNLINEMDQVLSASPAAQAIVFNLLRNYPGPMSF